MPTLPNFCIVEGDCPVTSTQASMWGGRGRTTLDDDGPSGDPVDGGGGISDDPGGGGRDPRGGNGGNGGDLGDPNYNFNTRLLLNKAYRETAQENVLTPLNHRYRGNREAWKFLLPMQRLLAFSSSEYISLEERYRNLETTESQSCLTDDEISTIYHIMKQIRFKEWLLLKDTNVRWFV